MWERDGTGDPKVARGNARNASLCRYPGAGGGAGILIWSLALGGRSTWCEWSGIVHFMTLLKAKLERKSCIIETTPTWPSSYPFFIDIINVDDSPLPAPPTTPLAAHSSDVHDSPFISDGSSKCFELVIEASCGECCWSRRLGGLSSN